MPFEVGDRVTLKADTKQHVWRVLHLYPHGAIRIIKEHAAHDSPTAGMNTYPEQLRRTEQ